MFNMGSEVLTKMVLQTQSSGIFTGFAPDLVDNGMAILQYADDTVLFITHDPEKAVNVKLLLYVLELMSGLKINFLKSEIFLIRGDNTVARFYSDLFNWRLASFLLNILVCLSLSRI
jgi:hypothetical protein